MCELIKFTLFFYVTYTVSYTVTYTITLLRSTASSGSAVNNNRQQCGPNSKRQVKLQNFNKPYKWFIVEMRAAPCESLQPQIMGHISSQFTFL
jgi:hypothetical protein